MTASSPRQPNLKCGWLGGGQNGGLNPLYQTSDPRSVQLALKLQF